MNSSVKYGFYMPKKAKLTKEFQILAENVRHFNTRRYGNDQAQAIIVDAT